MGSLKPAFLSVALSASLSAVAVAQESRIDRGRFTFLFDSRDQKLATSLAESSIASDTFPGLPRPTQHVIIAIAPDRRRFREMVGASAPEWGSAIAFPEARRIVLQGQRAGSDAGDPLLVARHELAHLALHEFLGTLPQRWFDEGYASYAAHEWDREDVLMTNLALAVRGMPTLEQLEASFSGGATSAQSAYALAYRAVAEMAQLDQVHGLSLFFGYWKSTRSFERAVRQAFGITSTKFEEIWRSNTRKRYGALAVVSNVTLAALVMLFVLTPLYVIRRRRDRRRLETMKAADAAAEEAAKQRAIDELLEGP